MHTRSPARLAVAAAALRAGVAAQIAVRATDAQAALSLIRSKGLKAETRDGEVVVTLKSGEGVETASVALNHALVQAGGSTKPLQDVFVSSENLLSVMDRVTGLYSAIKV